MTQNRIKKYLRKSTRRNMCGVAAVEFGIMLPILITLIFGIVEYGRMLYQYNTLVKSVRDGARYLSVYSYSPLDTTYYPAHKTEAACIVMYGTTDCSGKALVTGLNKTNVNFIQSTSGTVNMVTVTIPGFSLGYITGYFTSIPLTFGAISITMRQAVS